MVWFVAIRHNATKVVTLHTYSTRKVATEFAESKTRDPSFTVVEPLGRLDGNECFILDPDSYGHIK